MKHYIVKVIDGYTAEATELHFYGELSSITANGKVYTTIVNEHGTPLFISGLNTVSVMEF